MLTMLRQRLMGLPGGGHSVLPWIMLSDAVSAIVLALHSAAVGEIYNRQRAGHGARVRRRARACVRDPEAVLDFVLARTATDALRRSLPRPHRLAADEREGKLPRRPRSARRRSRRSDRNQLISHGHHRHVLWLRHTTSSRRVVSGDQAPRPTESDAASARHAQFLTSHEVQIGVAYSHPAQSVRSQRESWEKTLPTFCP
jgi:hypothetical protein